MRALKIGTTRSHRKGYVIVRTELGWELQHRDVMQRKLKRKLRTDEHVHHKDGDKRNNDLSNLEVIQAGPHKAMHMALERKYKENILCVSCGAPRWMIRHKARGLCARCVSRQKITEIKGRPPIPRKNWENGELFGFEFGGNGSKGLRKYLPECAECGRSMVDGCRGNCKGLCSACYCRARRKEKNPEVKQRRRRFRISESKTVPRAPRP
jgi:ribosomal protein S27AE